ncbi:23S rRNA pseudouridine(2604) synthase RluF [Colwellia sp. MB02u-6]|uniref:23S rRNA pseudouridine(2604) synthase RluF n=1 Tax=Colwellia sp. MB02u-6 TaxID=2759824 RepID=UPI0015F37748|nr:23S rRNA pseudouridine(2604) synthase RluF [Colwellia sp. MB02u-6]MBA6328188.1 23S rRNA pseudouridine(2604) synthase RluF [Colwellia sp. MB02u-6]
MSSYEKRLNKYISDSGYCSRRFADKLIENNRVTINGKVPELGTKVVSGDTVCIDGNEIKASASNHTDRVYIAYNKPIGITCTTERQVKGNIIDAIGHTKRIFPIGRLDKPSEGLIFLTSDGDIVNKILRAENAHDKEYIVKVDKPISERFVERMSKGVPILGTITKPCIVKHESKYVFRIILTQGLNRQIRRMCEYLDYEVIELQRSRIMNVELGNLRSGDWRDLTTSEMAEINTAVAGSRKTALGDNFTAAEVTEAEVIDDDLVPVGVNVEVEKVVITDVKHASKTIVSKSPAASRTLTRIDVKKPTTTSLGKKRLSLKKKS